MCDIICSSRITVVLVSVEKYLLEDKQNFQLNLVGDNTENIVLYRYHVYSQVT